VGSVTTLLLAETKESEIMDNSSKQQRTYEESEGESWKRSGKSKELQTGNWKSLKKGRRKRTRKKRRRRRGVTKWKTSVKHTGK
jgi:hypothetical protein